MSITSSITAVGTLDKPRLKAQTLPVPIVGYTLLAAVNFNQMFITKIKQGAETFHEFRGRLLYAEVRDNNDELVCSATLEFILRAFFDRQNEVQNYKEVLMKYLDFNDKMIRHVS